MDHLPDVQLAVGLGQHHYTLLDGLTYTGDPQAVGMATVGLRWQVSKRFGLSLAFDNVVTTDAPGALEGCSLASVSTFNVGMVSNIYSTDSKSIFQTQIPLNPGNSGGPIVDRLGRVVGIVTAGIKGANSINFGIDISVALKTLPHLRAALPGLTLRAPTGVPVFVGGKNVGLGPVVVVPPIDAVTEAFVVVDGAMVRRTLRPGQTEVSFGGESSTPAYRTRSVALCDGRCVEVPSAHAQDHRQPAAAAGLGRPPARLSAAPQTPSRSPRGPPASPPRTPSPRLPALFPLFFDAGPGVPRTAV